MSAPLFRAVPQENPTLGHFARKPTNNGGRALLRPRPRDTSVLEFVTPWGVASFGTVIRVVVEPLYEGGDVVITAWPGAQLFDWGASRRAVNRLVRGLSAGNP